MTSNNQNTKEDKIILELSKSQFRKLRKLFIVLAETYNINDIIWESCMALLLEMNKPNKIKMKNFISNINNWTDKVRKEMIQNKITKQ